MKTRLLVLLSILFCLAVSLISHAQIPRTLSYQGVLTDNAGKPRPDGSYNFTFRFYTSPTGGTAIWSESKSLPVKSGLFSTVLGDQDASGIAVKFDQQYWLGIQVGSDPELSPRVALTSVGYSFSSLRADTARVSVASLADTTWRHSGANIYRMNGNIGIGTTSPQRRLQIGAEDNAGIGFEGFVASPNAGTIRFGDGTGWRFHIGRSREIPTGALNSGNAGVLMTIQDNGNVGIGTEAPQSKFHINNVASTNAMKIETVGGYGTLVENINPDYGGNAKLTWINSINQNPDSYHLYVEGGQEPELVVQGNGNVGIGTEAPQSKFHINNVASPNAMKIETVRGYGALVENINPGYGGNAKLTWINSINQNPDSYHLYVEGDQKPELVVQGNGNVGIGTNTPQYPLDVNGRTRTKVLEITAGMDLAEPFEISESQPIRQGALVIIDEDNPGRLKLSHQAYDKRVAGVVSGAGGINPGITLTQEGVLEGGQNVALSGRVYALATAANGPIKPGDLLTTSEVAGHAMKATDRELWPGAVIGKAMSKLESGEGLVLVLVNLQ